MIQIASPNNHAVWCTCCVLASESETYTSDQFHKQPKSADVVCWVINGWCWQRKCGKHKPWCLSIPLRAWIVLVPPHHDDNYSCCVNNRKLYVQTLQAQSSWLVGLVYLVTILMHPPACQRTGVNFTLTFRHISFVAKHHWHVEICTDLHH